MAKLNKQEKLNRMEDYIKDYVTCFTPCMSQETTEKWINIFGNKMCERRLDEDQIDLVQSQLGFELNDKDKKDFRRLWKDIFKETMLEYIKALKKAKSDEEKEEIRKNNGMVKRKVDSPSKKKK